MTLCGGSEGGCWETPGEATVVFKDSFSYWFRCKKCAERIRKQLRTIDPMEPLRELSQEESRELLILQEVFDP